MSLSPLKLNGLWDRDYLYALFFSVEYVTKFNNKRLKANTNSGKEGNKYNFYVCVVYDLVLT